MAMIKCKECNREVSDKAKLCPNCGAKVQKPVGPLGIILALLVGWFFYSAFSVDNSSPSITKNAAPSVGTIAKPQTPQPIWRTNVSIDEMTGAKQAFALSPKVSPTRTMDFPYSNVTAWVGVGCENASEWAFFGFSTAPNISNDDTKSGYHVINTRVKWNDSIINTRLIQNWGAKFIHFSDESEAIIKLANSSRLMLELNWHGQGNVNFNFPLTGSSAAIQEMREKCK